MITIHPCATGLTSDAVVITLYNTVISLKNLNHLHAGQLGIAISSFLVVSLGGVLCGITLGLLTSVAAKYCNRVRGMIT